MSSTVTVPVRGLVDGLAATSSCTGWSPWRGMVDVTVIHGVVVAAVQMQRSCRGPPQTFGVACCSTSKLTVPPAAGTVTTGVGVE